MPILNRPSATIAVLGCGGGIVPSVLHKNYPKLNLDVVEISPQVISAAKTYFGLVEDERLRIHEADALTWLENANPKSYDIIMVDVAAPNVEIDAALELPPKEFISEEFLNGPLVNDFTRLQRY